MAIALENQASTSGTGVAGLTPVTLALAVTSANKIVVVVSVGDHEFVDAVPSSVTYAGQALTLAVSSTDSNFETVSIWYRDSPTAGTNNVSVTWSTNCDQYGIAASGLVGALSGAPSSTNTGTGNTANPSVTVASTVSGDIVIGAYASDLGPDGGTTAAGHSFMDAEDVALDSDFSAQDVTASGASTAVSWTALAPSAGSWAIAAAAFRSEVAASTVATSLKTLGTGIYQQIVTGFAR